MKEKKVPSCVCAALTVTVSVGLSAEGEFCIDFGEWDPEGTVWMLPWWGTYYRACNLSSPQGNLRTTEVSIKYDYTIVLCQVSSKELTTALGRSFELLTITINEKYSVKMLNGYIVLMVFLRHSVTNIARHWWVKPRPLSCSVISQVRCWVYIDWSTSSLQVTDLIIFWLHRIGFLVCTELGHVNRYTNQIEF